MSYPRWKGSQLPRSSPMVTSSTFTSMVTCGACLPKLGFETATKSCHVTRSFRYRDHLSYAGFSNYFRYKLLLERGGWWVDLDTVCLKPFDFDDEFVFSSEQDVDGEQTPNVGFIKSPAHREIAGELWQFCRSRDPARIASGETGPRLRSSRRSPGTAWSGVSRKVTSSAPSVFSSRTPGRPGREMVVP